MPQEIRIWNVTSDTTPVEMSRSEIDLEKRLESLLKNDISILDPDLLARRIHGCRSLTVDFTRAWAGVRRFSAPGVEVVSVGVRG